MPELPEVETARRLADRHVVGKTIEKVFATDDRIVYVDIAPRTFANKLRGRTVEAVCRRGKQMWMQLDHRPWPTFHFGMSGSFWAYTDPRDRPTYTKIELLMDDGTRLAMRNPRRLGRIRLQEDPPNEPPTSKLGPDPLTDMPSPNAFVALISDRKAPVKALLLNQQLFAGVGNWIADEVLYQAKIHPARRGVDLSDAEIRRMRTTLKRVITRAVDVSADKSRFPRTWLFHHRWGRNSDAVTSRGEKIEHDTIGGRTTAYVPSVQK